MLLTDEKIMVSHEMMVRNNMHKGSMTYGIPKDVNNLSSGLVWKDLMEFDDADLAILEEYFLAK